MQETTSETPLTEIAVLVPEGRVADFYALVGAWLRSDGIPRARRGSEPRSGRRANVKSKYAPLGEHLARTDTETLTLGFDAIEDILDAELPRSARKHRAWWANTESHSQAGVWMEQGWLVTDVRLEESEITFSRA